MKKKLAIEDASKELAGDNESPEKEQDEKKEASGKPLNEKSNEVLGDAYAKADMGDKFKMASPIMNLVVNNTIGGALPKVVTSGEVYRLCDLV